MISRGRISASNALAPVRAVSSRFMTLAIIALAAASLAQGEEPATYPDMAPIDQYLMDRNAEIKLARSAAPESISREAEVMVLGRHGYESAVKGKNGFVCIVERSWAAPLDDPGFWNPKLRGPICFNAPAVRSYLPHTIKKTEWVLAGHSNAQMYADIKSAIANKEWLIPEIGAMCFMMSKQGYLSDRDGHWHPHLMFFLPPANPAAWGANLPGSPIFAAEDAPGGLTIFMVPVAQWSDGTAALDKDH
jgi:hypothetical protein